MAPEMITEEEYGPAIDFFSLGLVIYEMITGGQHPFKTLGPNASPARVMLQIV